LLAQAKDLLIRAKSSLTHQTSMVGSAAPLRVGAALRARKIVSFQVNSKVQRLLAQAKNLLIRAKSYNAATAT
jgi:hypothetical protein